MDRAQALEFLTTNDNHHCSERLVNNKNIDALVAAGDYSDSLANAFLCLQLEEMLENERETVIRAQHNALSVAMGLKVLNDVGLLATERSIILQHGRYARNIAVGLSKLFKAGVLNQYKTFVINANRNAGAVGSAIAILHNADLIAPELETILSHGEYASSIAMGLDSLEKEGLRERYRGVVIASGQNAVSVGAAIALLKKHDRLDAPNLSVIARNPEQASALAHEIVFNLDFSSDELRYTYPARLRSHVGSLRYDPKFDVISADQVQELAKIPERFYEFTDAEKMTFDMPAIEYDQAHTGPEIRKMIFMYHYLEHNKYIPRTTKEIQVSLEQLLKFSNNLDERVLGKDRLVDSTIRMFKLAIDRLLRHNEKLIEGQDWSSRSLILGLFNAVQDQSVLYHTDGNELNQLQLAFVYGVRHVIEAESVLSLCDDIYCRTASTDGFFAGSKEVTDLRGINPACHGRLRNLTIELAILFGFPKTLFNEIKFLINSISDDASIVLKNKLTSVIESDMSAESFQISDNNEDQKLYRLGIDQQLLANLVQIHCGYQIDTIPKESNIQLKYLLDAKLNGRGILHEEKTIGNLKVK